MSTMFIYVVANDRISFFYYGWIIISTVGFVCDNFVCDIFFIQSFVDEHLLGYHTKCCNEWKSAVR